MSKPAAHTHADHVNPETGQEIDAVESIALVAPLVLPLVGGVLMFLLAFIAVYMA